MWDASPGGKRRNVAFTVVISHHRISLPSYDCLRSLNVYAHDPSADRNSDFGILSWLKNLSMVFSTPSSSILPFHSSLVIYQPVTHSNGPLQVYPVMYRHAWASAIPSRYLFGYDECAKIDLRPLARYPGLGTVDDAP
ncbi:hypothetical protein WG66_007646 [Moniliophthora roreri]|nr:hypothetical protein WG66_007646 [Moniliophthora roreri]